MTWVSFWHTLKNKPVKRSLAIALSIFFFFIALFQAWQDESQKRIMAESDSGYYKQQSEYNQRRVDKLSDVLVAENATNKTSTETITSQNNQSPVIQGNQSSIINQPTIVEGTTISGGNNQIGGAGNVLNVNPIVTNEDNLIHDFETEIIFTFSGKWTTTFLPIESTQLIGSPVFATVFTDEGNFDPTIKFHTRSWKMTAQTNGLVSVIYDGAVEVGDFPLGHTIDELGKYRNLKITVTGLNHNYLSSETVVFVESRFSYFVNGVKKFEYDSEQNTTLPVTNAPVTLSFFSTSTNLFIPNR